MATLIHGALRRLLNRAAKPYAATSIEDARQICRDLACKGFGNTVCFWDGPSDTTEDIRSACLDLIGLLQEFDTDSYLSIKLPGMRFEHDAVSSVLKCAARYGRLVHFDSHGPEHTDRMFQAIQSGLQDNRNLGCTIPGRWTRSIQDARTAADWGLRVRVVKGQWADVAKPGIDMREGFLNVIDAIAGRAQCVAVATHDVPLAEKSLERLLSAGTKCEMELLYGLPRNASINLARKLNVPVRFYVPQGTAWLPYAIKHARNNPRVLAWFAYDLIRGCTARL